ncbi:MAG: peroxiredoxin family protein [Actinomycetota bacterium]
MGNRSRQRQAAARKKTSTNHRIIALLVFGGVLLVMLGWVRFQRPTPVGSTGPGDAAPTFALMSAAGQRISLSDYAGRNLLVYFSEGVGCDACFTQMVDLEATQKRFDDLDIALLGIMVNPGEAIARDAARFGIRMPILVDESKSVSKAYDTLGRGMHADLPGHGFILIDAQGTVLWRKDYPSMYVGPKELLDEVSAALEATATGPKS